jgi:iron complex transport system substrate-binding protein
MKLHTNKVLLLILSLMLAFIAAACGQQASPAASAPQQGAAPAPAAGKEPRIASLSIHLTNHLLALGITPAGSVIGGDVKDFLPHVADRLKTTKKLGVVSDLDMEALLALNPDVIYVDQTYAGKDLSKYEKIAPTFSFNLDDGTWRDTLKAVAKLVNKQPQAEAFIKDYDAQAAKVKELVRNGYSRDG